jgi:hypothetical protein
VLRFKIAGIGRRPMLIQCRTDLLISRSRIRLILLLIVHTFPRRIYSYIMIRDTPEG